mgnify:CR=1 FL=1
MAEFMHFNSSQPVDEDALHSRTAGGGKSPKYVVRCDKLFSSEMKGLEDCAPCDWVKTGGSRITSFDASGKLVGNAKITGKDPIISMKYGPWGPVLQQHMYNGTTLEMIHVYRLSDVNGEKIIMQELNYDTCLIKTYDQNGDNIVFTFCYVSVEDLHVSYDQDGNKLGQSGMQFNFTTLKVKSSPSS